MELTLEILAGVSCIELLLWTTLFWRIHATIASGLLLVLAVMSGALLSQQLSAWVVIVTILSLYRAINLLRVVQGRVQGDYLYHTSRQSAFCLIGWQVLIVSIVKLTELYHVNALSWFYVLGAAQLAGTLVLLLTVTRQLKTTLPPVVEEGLPDRELPSLTVAIPARNETADLEACLRSLIASNYLKLEILVLDDCSQNKHTPEIIRGFAHDGVRFIAGKTPPPHWLAKNYAYAQLTEESNGELLLFCGVDARFEPQSLNLIVKILLQKKKGMISILPNNRLTDGGGMKALLLQPSRYAWELALPRRLLQRPPVLSTCWIITRQALETAGGFRAVIRKVVPESYLARQIAAADDGYSFLQANTAIGVKSYKSFQDQRDTAIRTRYPQLHRRPELVAVISLVEFALLVWPFIILAISIMTRTVGLVAFTSLTCLINITWYSKVVSITYRKFNIRGLCFLPLAALYDIGLLNYSMWQYEFNEVLWKGRNVCVPIMRVIPRLVEVRNKNSEG